MRAGSLSLCVTDGPVPIGKCDHIYPEVCVCVYVCVRESERHREQKRDREREIHTQLLDSDVDPLFTLICELQ